MPDLYDSYQFMSVVKLLKRIVFSPTKLRRLASYNRLHDYLALDRKRDLLLLHRELTTILYEQAKLWETYDYGEGYFYQGSARLGITGFRDTEARFVFMDLENRLKGKSVLDIGCNSGFLTLECANTAAEVTAMEINPFLIRAATACAAFLDRKNTFFLAETFEDFTTDKTFDVVMSFANHSTYDHNTSQSTTNYFDKCKSLLKNDGVFLFESHAPDYEGERLAPVLELIEERFTILEQKVMDKGNFLDKGRTFLVGIPR